MTPSETSHSETYSEISFPVIAIVGLLNKVPNKNVNKYLENILNN